MFFVSAIGVNEILFSSCVLRKKALKIQELFISRSILEGEVKGAYRLTLFSSGATGNLVKFHLIRFPNIPLVFFLMNSKTGSISVSFTHSFCII